MRTLAAAVLPAMAALMLGALSATAEADDEPQTVRLLRIFLADFEDVPHPEGYTRERFEQLFFGLGEPRVTPEGRGMSGSVREYFLDVSEGRLDVEGEVTEWVRLPEKITKVPHWKGGMEPFGESWPVIVAETLRANGIVGEDAKEKVRLADGRMPELLVFLNTDWGTGGVNRDWGHLKDVLGKMHLSDLWDEGWLGLPSPLSSYSATKWRKAPASAPDGTIDAVPPAEELEMFPLSVMMHEMGHQLAGWPDLYGAAFEPWGVFDLMGGPAAETHYPMGVSAYLRVSSGWMDYTDMPRAALPRLSLRPLDTHREAFRFPQGPGQESIVAENRSCLFYPHDWGQPPTNQGPRLLLYRLDPAARRRMMYGDSPQGKVTTVIRRPEHYGEVWGEAPFTEVTATTVPTSRNSLGELWWEFRDIQPAPDNEVEFDARFAAADFVADYDRAAWTTGDGAALATGRFGRPEGHVGLRSLQAEGGPPRHSLEVRTGPSGTIRGRYHLPDGGPRRAYVLVRVPDDGRPVRCSVTPVGTGAVTEVDLAVGEADRQQCIVAEVPAATRDLELVIQAADPSDAARVLVDGAWLVGLPPLLMDLVGAAPDGGWTPSPAEATATVGPPEPLALPGRYYYGPHVLALPLGRPACEGWRAEWLVRLPDSPAMLRGLIGIAADAPVGSSARVTLRLAGPEREWTLVGNVEVGAHPDGDADGGNLPAVVEVPLPGEMRGQVGTFVMEAALTSDGAFRVAVPYLSICLE